MSTICAIFTGIRGAVFTLCTGRVNIRIRKRLHASLLRQEIGFFDTTKMGDLTSRLGTDTNTMADMICELPESLRNTRTFRVTDGYFIHFSAQPQRVSEVGRVGCGRACLHGPALLAAHPCLLHHNPRHHNRQPGEYPYPPEENLGPLFILGVCEDSLNAVSP